MYAQCFSKIYIAMKHERNASLSIMQLSESSFDL